MAASMARAFFQPRAPPATAFRPRTLESHVAPAPAVPAAAAAPPVKGRAATAAVIAAPVVPKCTIPRTTLPHHVLVIGFKSPPRGLKSGA